MRTIPTTKSSLVCPHCQTRGSVRTRRAPVNQGVSGAKVLLAICTLGLSALVTGLSRYRTGTKAHCTNCGQRWQF